MGSVLSGDADAIHAAHAVDLPYSTCARPPSRPSSLAHAPESPPASSSHIRALLCIGNGIHGVMVKYAKWKPITAGPRLCRREAALPAHLLYSSMARESAGGLLALPSHVCLV